MAGIFDLDTWRQVFLNSVTELGTTLARFFPSVVGMLVIVVVGWLVSRVVEVVATRALRRLGLDRVGTRLRLSDSLQRAGISAAPSRILGRFLFWILMLTFVLSGVEALGLRAVATTIDRLIAYLPNVIAAGLILFLGFVLGRLARNLVNSGAMAANLVQVARLSGTVSTLVVLVAIVLALEQLGVETQILVTVTTALVTVLGLAMGLAFALGARPVLSHILAGHFIRQSLAVDSVVEIQGRKGTLARVGPTETLFRDGERSWSIPNSRLLEEIVTR